METHVPSWALSIIYWLHMAATAIWIGGLAAFAVIIQPLLQKNLLPDAYSRILSNSFKVLQRIGWMGLLVLSATGLFQMGASPYYQGFIQIHNQWAVAILLKHIAVGLMIITVAYGTFVVQPALQRGVFLEKIDPDGGVALRRKLERRQVILLRLNFGIALLVLFFTAIARVS
jgi:uncharacterized membrane protein